VYKGSNNLTEMYSAIRAEVPIENDPSTQTNDELLQYFWQASKVIVCGQARSHCVNYTVRDIVADWQSRLDPADHKKELSRIILLNDGMSDVGGFETTGGQFIEEMRELGLTIADCGNPFST
jgi:nicotinamidase/pyrazinamidase